MERQTLERMTLTALRDLARELAVKNAGAMERDALVEAILLGDGPGQPAPAPALGVTHMPFAGSATVVQTDAPPPHFGVPISEMGALPRAYGRTRVVVLAQKPGYFYAYWEVREDDLAAARGNLGGVDAALVLRVSEVPGAALKDIAIYDAVGEWFFDAEVSWQSIRVILGLKTADEQWVTLAESAEVRAPAAGPSARTDPEWSIKEGDFETIYALSGGLEQGPGSARLQRVMGEGWVPTSSGSPVVPR